jgi:propanediol utilization protein
MNQEKVKLIIQNMELLLQALKEEVSEVKIKNNHLNLVYDDYDEVFEE